MKTDAQEIVLVDESQQTLRHLLIQLQSADVLIAGPGSKAYYSWMLRDGGVLLIPPIVTNFGSGAPKERFSDKDLYGSFPHVVLQRLPTAVAKRARDVGPHNLHGKNVVWALCKTTEGLSAKWGKGKFCDYETRCSQLQHAVANAVQISRAGRDGDKNYYY